MKEVINTKEAFIRVSDVKESKFYGVQIQDISIFFLRNADGWYGINIKNGLRFWTYYFDSLQQIVEFALKCEYKVYEFDSPLELINFFTNSKNERI